MDDKSTSDVIDWLRYFEISFVRIDHTKKIDVQKVKIVGGYFESVLKINNEEFIWSEFKAIWYRRSWLKINTLSFESQIAKAFQNSVNQQLQSEGVELSLLLLNSFDGKQLNKFKDTKISKMELLIICDKYGIKTPNSLITSSKSELRGFIQENDVVVTKNFSPGVFVKHKNSIVGSLTQVVGKDVYASLPSKFSPMLFQEAIEKVFEIRAFFIDDKFYCSAIFSQEDDKTQVDFRNYNYERPNRTPPFVLPEKYQNKLSLLMKEIGLNSGSIDLLVTPNGEFVFLEVNPVGQFSQVSLPCNYLLEKEIAVYLS